MPFCTKCGEEISDRQATQFNSICPKCIRIDRVKTIKKLDAQQSGSQLLEAKLKKEEKNIKKAKCVINFDSNRFQYEFEVFEEFQPTRARQFNEIDLWQEIYDKIVSTLKHEYPNLEFVFTKIDHQNSSYSVEIKSNNTDINNDEIQQIIDNFIK